MDRRTDRQAGMQTDRHTIEGKRGDRKRMKMGFGDLRRGEKMRQIYIHKYQPACVPQRLNQRQR